MRQFAYIAQASAPTPTAPNLPADPLAQYGLLGAAIVVMINQGMPIIKDTFNWFRNKEDDSDRLTNTLIEDLRIGNKALLEAIAATMRDIKDVQVQGTKNLDGLKKAAEELHTTSQREMGTVAALVAEMHAMRDMLVRLDDKSIALHNRLDWLFLREDIGEKPPLE